MDTMDSLNPCIRKSSLVKKNCRDVHVFSNAPANEKLHMTEKEKMNLLLSTTTDYAVLTRWERRCSN